MPNTRVFGVFFAVACMAGAVRGERASRKHKRQPSCGFNSDCGPAQKCTTLFGGLFGAGRCVGCLTIENQLNQECSLFSPIEKTCCDGYTCRVALDNPRGNKSCYRSLIGHATDLAGKVKENFNESACHINSDCADGQKCDTLTFGLGGAAKCVSCLTGEDQKCSLFSPIEQTCCDGYTCRVPFDDPRGTQTCHRSLVGHATDLVGKVKENFNESECHINSDCADGQKCDTLTFGLAGAAKCVSCLTGEDQKCSLISPIEKTCCDGYTCRVPFDDPRGTQTCHRSLVGHATDLVGKVKENFNESECTLNSDCADGQKCDTLTFGLAGAAKCVGCLIGEDQVCKVFSPIEKTCCDGYTCRPSGDDPRGAWTCHRSLVGKAEDKWNQLREQRTREEVALVLLDDETKLP